MKKLQNIVRISLTKALEAGVFFMALTRPVAAQLREGVEGATPEQLEGQTLFDEGGVFQTITNTILLIVGAVSVLMLIIGGLRYVLSGGDREAVEGAKNQILYAIIGIVVAFLAFAMVDFVLGQLGA